MSNKLGFDICRSNAAWHDRVNGWISALAGVEAGWTNGDLLFPDRADASRRMITLKSTHAREKQLPEIELRHLWIEMA
jgi:hypothetical protein